MGIIAVKKAWPTETLVTKKGKGLDRFKSKLK